MAKSPNVQCPTPICVQAIEDYGERYHKVVEHADDATRPNYCCESCGGISQSGETWEHKCRTCKADVPPGKLCGLFVPHLCASCEQAETDKAVKSNKICRACRQPFNRCCC